MSRLLLSILAGALLLPVLLVKAGYGFVNSFPYGSYQPLAVITGHYLSVPMFLGGFFGLFLGMIYPRLVLWWGEASRGLVARVYVSVFLCGVLLQCEIYLLRDVISADEASAAADLYESLGAGLSKDEVLAIQRRVAGGLRYTNANDSDFTRTPGFPFKGRPTPVLKITAPGYGFEEGVVVQLSARWDDTNARSERIVLIEDSQVTAIKPALAESDPRIYWGVLSVGPDRQTFTPCNGQEMALDVSEFLDLRADKSGDYDFFTEYTRYYTEPYQRVRGIIIGYEETGADGARRFKILTWTRLERDGGFTSYPCEKPENGL